MPKSVTKDFKVSESYISMGLGLLVVIIAAVLLFNYMANKNKPEISEKAEQTNEVQQQGPGSTYTVAQGDSLWSISEKFYNTGYSWSEIAKANNLTNADSIEVGQQINIPKLDTQVVAQANDPQPTTVSEQNPEAELKLAATGEKNYTVQTGDYLWKIAEEKYNDGYKWTEIAKANNLENPDIIHAGNVLVLP